MTKVEILALAELREVEYKKTEEVPVFYKRNGKMVERSYPDTVYTETYKFLAFSKESPLKTEKIFRSSVSGKMFSYDELEKWVCDFEKDRYISSAEYEDEMGEDL